MRKIRKVICVAILIVISMATGFCNENNAQSFNWKNVIKAIAHIESRGDSLIVSKSGNHVGYLQISKVMIRDCNEKLGYKKYTYDDRYSKTKSIEIFIEIQRIYNPNNNIEKAIRSWHGGQGYTKRGTNRYYQQALKKLNCIKGIEN